MTFFEESKKKQTNQKVLFFEASSMRELYTEINEWVSNSAIGLASFSIKKDGDIFTCIAISNSTVFVSNAPDLWEDNDGHKYAGTCDMFSEDNLRKQEEIINKLDLIADRQANLPDTGFFDGLVETIESEGFGGLVAKKLEKIYKKLEEIRYENSFKE